MLNSQVIFDEIEAKGRLSKLNLFNRYLVVIFAIFISVYHLYVLGVKPMSAWIFYTIHLSSAIILVFAIYPLQKNKKNTLLRFIDLISIISMAAVTVYLIANMNDIISRISTSPTGMDLIASTILIIFVLETTRRTNGTILPLLAILFLLYGKFGYLFPGVLQHRGYEWERIVGYLTGFDGLYSSPISATANFVFIFIIFGAFLSASGSGKFFIDFALGATGKRRGGPAKAGVFASALMGTVSGTSVSNVVATGAFTIPLMKKVGYSPRFAGAVESVASTGGQIMPPILGSAAFIMAAMTGTPYLDIVIASILPAFLYFFAVYVMIDLEAAKTGLKGLPKSEIPNPINVLKKSGYLITPLLVLIFVLTILNSSPNKAALWAIVTAFIISMIKKHTRMSLNRTLSALANAALSAIGIISACATAGIIIGILNLTGVGLKLASFIINFSGGSLFFALVLTMVACLILGMGLPTAASYIITATVMAPVLIQLGTSLLSAHMFVFYYACLSAITPPVALAAFAGAAIAKAKPMEVAFTSVKLGIIAFIVPFMFVYDPILLFDGSVIEIIIATITAIIGTFILASGVQGWFIGNRVNVLSRFILLVGSLCLIIPGLLSDLIGGGIILIFIIYDKRPKGNSANKLSA
jgi:TRAP transporter 4TM/12TM fusion protein